MKSRAISFLETSVRRLVLFSDGSQFNHQFIRDFVSMVLQRKQVQTHILHRFSMSRNWVTFHRVKELSIISTKFFCSTESNMNAILLWDTWTSWIYNELVISVPLAVRFFPWYQRVLAFSSRFTFIQFGCVTTVEDSLWLYALLLIVISSNKWTEEKTKSKMKIHKEKNSKLLSNV